MMKEPRQPERELNEAERHSLVTSQIKRRKVEAKIKPGPSNVLGFVMPVAKPKTTYGWVPKVSLTSSLFTNPEFGTA